MQKQVHLRIIGQVQGVSYRAYTQEFAKTHKITGWIRNNENEESVEILAQGKEEDLKQLIVWSWEGPPSARVDDIEIQWQEPAEKFKDFQIQK